MKQKAVGMTPKEEMSELSQNYFPFARTGFFATSDTPFKKGATLAERPDVIVSNGFFSFAYRNVLKGTSNMNTGRSFVWSSADNPLVRNNKKSFRRFMNWEQLMEQAKGNEKLSFVLKYTNLCPRMLEIAKDNPDTLIPLSFDILKYIDDHGGETNIQCLEYDQADRARKRLIYEAKVAERKMIREMEKKNRKGK